MNILEGSRRMKQAGRWMLFLALTVMVLLVGISGVMSLYRGDLRTPLALIPMSLPFFVPGAALWLAGWIVEGFSKEPR